MFRHGFAFPLLLVLLIMHAGPKSFAGVGWTPVGQPPLTKFNQPSNPLLVWSAGPNSLLQNEGFEEGISNAWTVETVRGNGFTANYQGAPGLAGVPVVAGRISACLSGKAQVGSESAIYQDITLPADVTSAV